MTIRKLRTTFSALLLVLISGCARSPAIHYYQLVSPEPARSDQVAPAGLDVVLGLGPVHLPEYLDQQKIVSRLSANRLQLSDVHRWIEPLADNFTRVLQQELASRLHPRLMVIFPWPLSQRVNIQVIVDVLRFETESDGTAWLLVNWRVQNREGKLLQPEKQASFRTKRPAHDYGDRVQALNEALDQFADELAAQLLPLLQKAAAS